MAAWVIQKWMVIGKSGLVGRQRGLQTPRWNGLANYEFQRVRTLFRVILSLRTSSSTNFGVPQPPGVLHIHVFEKNLADIWSCNLLRNAVACHFSLMFCRPAIALCGLCSTPADTMTSRGTLMIVPLAISIQVVIFLSTCSSMTTRLRRVFV